MEPLPIFKVWIYSRETFDTEEKARILVDYLLSNPRFAPNHFGEAEPYQRLTPDKKPKAISLIENRVGQQVDPERVLSMVIFEQTKKPSCSYCLTWSKLPHRAFEINAYDIHKGFVENQHDLQEWLDFVFGFLHLQKAWYALFALDEETNRKNFLTWHTLHPKAKDYNLGVETLRGVGVELTEGIPGIYWGNYFGPFYVDWFGREKLVEIPCIQKQWLGTGGLFFTTASSPAEWNTVETIKLQQEIKQQIGEDAFFDIECVRYVMSELEPIPQYLKPEMLQPPRRVPKFPFEIKKLPKKPPEELAKEAISYFTKKGFIYDGIQDEALVFHYKNGGITKVTL